MKTTYVSKMDKKGHDIYIYITGTWNIMTMLKACKMNEIANEMLKTQLQIIALQELRWKGERQINKTKLYTLLQL